MWADKITDQRVPQKAEKVRSIVAKIKERKKTWVGHVLRLVLIFYVWLAQLVNPRTAGPMQSCTSPFVLLDYLNCPSAFCIALRRIPGAIKA